MKNFLFTLGVIATTCASAQTGLKTYLVPDTGSQVIRFYIHDFPHTEYKWGQITTVSPVGDITSYSKEKLYPNNYVPIQSDYVAPGTMVILDMEDRYGDYFGSYTAYITQNEHGEFNRNTVEPHDLVDLIVFTGNFYEYIFRGIE